MVSHALHPALHTIESIYRSGVYTDGCVIVHNMGDAGFIMFGWFGRELLATGTIVFAVFATGSQMLSGQLALNTLSDNKLCLIAYTGIFAAPILLMSLPRTLDQLSWLSIAACASILMAGVVGIIAAGLHPVPGRSLDVVVSTNFYQAFVSITNPVFAYAGTYLT